MSKTILTESQLTRFITERIYNLLIEDKESKNMAKARNFLKKNGKSDDEAMNIVNSIRHDIPNVRLNQNKYALGATRLYNSGELNNASKIFNLNQLIGFISKVYDNQYDNNLNGATLNDLWVKYKPELEQQTQSSKEDLMKQTYNGKSDYKVVRIESFEEAHKYGEYVDWCITQTKSSFDNYTNNGLNLFYFLLKNGFENTSAVIGDDAPKDDYGLSMISVSVGEDGSMLTSASRWNHENGGSNNTFTVEEISRLLGQNFYDVCKPYSKEELQKKIEIINKPFMEIQQRLDDGESPNIIFDDIYTSSRSGISRIVFGRKFNFINSEKKLLSPNQWFDYADMFYDLNAMVRLNNKQNFINNSGKILSPDLWFDRVYDFEYGFSRVELNNKYNFMSQDGKLLSPNQWFDSVYDFENEFGRVALNNKWNYINRDGKLLSPDLWFDIGCDFKNGFGMVKLNVKWNYINQEGKLLSPDLWFDNVYDFNDGYALVKLNDKWNWINQDGKILSPDLWFGGAGDFYDGIAEVTLNNRWNYVNQVGQLLSPNQWFDSISSFEDGFGIVKLDDKSNYINQDGKFLSPDLWFDEVYYFKDGIAKVRLNNKVNFIKQDGKILSPNQWFDRADDFYDEVSEVQLNGKRSYLNQDGELLDY